MAKPETPYFLLPDCARTKSQPSPSVVLFVLVDKVGRGRNPRYGILPVTLKRLTDGLVESLTAGGIGFSSHQESRVQRNTYYLV